MLNNPLHRLKQVFEMIFAGKKLVVETGQVAKQANGSVVVRYGDSTVLTAAVMSKKMSTGDFSHFKSITKKKCMLLGNFREALTNVKG
ncbi:polyribonucleotide nucleotidyltransferase, partial [Streptococcus agalactiae CJB111]